MSRGRPWTRRLPLLGPAFVAAVAYVDPGNVATNVTAGARYGYTLVWVVVLANVMAMLVQYLSAKLGIVTERSLASHAGSVLSRRGRLAYWLQAQTIAVATDLAEVVGGSIALNLLFGVPLWLGAVIVTVVAIGVLKVGDSRGQHVLERVIVGLLGVIGIGFVAGLVVHGPTVGEVAGGMLPRFHGSESVLLASGIVGATVMPHAIYLHSSLTAGRLDGRGAGLGVGRLLEATRTDVVLALLVAGVLNVALLLVAAANLGGGLPGVDTLEGVYHQFGRVLGSGVALLFAVGLLVSGLASASVGTAAGAEMLASLTRLRLSAVRRRLISLVPTLVVLLAGTDPTRALVGSQVVLSIGIPFALVPLLVLTSSRRVMGEWVNSVPLTMAAGVACAAIVLLNVALLWLTFAG